MDAGDAGRRVTVQEYGRIGRERVAGGRLGEKTHDDERVAERGDPAPGGIALDGERGGGAAYHRSGSRMFGGSSCAMNDWPRTFLGCDSCPAALFCGGVHEILLVS